ncbi:hypothetical protein ASPACDRAFT_1891979 [Aspergillus aculeatus ATCC 16872]|uniref:NACHT domain-containing protein n=1 Tax=Aspergillus aculeatus (strain ATCC 16872 / CBS 172.66 / WB 5094) TaxID=690307 RepID=A0A1L9WFW3_ASPA1|nr:uncharacterized protein ASPACDRAFT_1891979 [Aspergillus aculeatus ATCC 16872]OJJ95066.1 hypothetical protein ASPACDRAFT_1891979 [Aspergillus aculeatus ATCC 16872]
MSSTTETWSTDTLVWPTIGLSDQPALRYKTQMGDWEHGTRTRNDYTVGWICALEEEQVAATAMLDQIHPDLPKPPNDPNTYTLGSIGHHQVVIACLPSGKYGNNPAATCANQMARTFQSVRVVLMVGIGGGVPPKVRLGDVVISTPVDRFSGVIQWDLGKAEKDGTFKPVGALNNPPTALLTAGAKMRTRHMLNGHQIPQYLDEMGRRFPRLVPRYTQSASLIDPQSPDAPDRARNELGHVESTQVHYGLIASGNQVIKDANMRNKIDQSFDGNVLCIEMEAAALMNNFPCIVIRGICDYADSTKEKSWQAYAAAVAAACAKELLHYVQPSEVDAELPVRSVLGDVIKTIRSTETQVKSMRSQLEKEEDARILNWFSKAEYGSRHSDILKNRQPGTGQWFLDSARYRKWRSLERQTVFCKGIQGSGKTMIAAIAIDNLHAAFLPDQSIGLAYLYCAFDRQKEQTVESLLASLIKQLSKGQPSLPDAVKELFLEHQRHNTRPSFDELSKTLLVVTSTYRRVFVVVDALDELLTSDGRLRQLLSQMFALQSRTNLSFLATSRPIPEIEKQFTACIMQTISASKEDIRSYIAGHLDRLPDFVIEDPALQEEIKDQIIKAAMGMFLIVRLYLESLVGLQAPRAIRTALKKLPHGSDAYDYAYSEAMQRVKSQPSAFRKAAEKALKWITSARRQLKVSELQHALAVEEGDTDLDESGIPRVTYILSVCAGLVTVDEESDAVRLVHYTTQEYFDRTRKHWFPDADDEIASTCVQYLSFHTFRLPCASRTALFRRLRAYKLYDYAAHWWGHHARVASSLCPAVRAFLEDDGLIQSSSQVLYSHDLQRKVRGVHMAALFGLAQAIMAVPQGTNDIDPRDQNGQTPLSIAAQQGHDIVACMLLDRGADVKSTDSTSHRTPLFHAVAGNHQVTVRLLLNRGARPDAKDIYGMTPLSHAAAQGHQTLVQLLLVQGADINARNNSNWTPLALAAENGHEKVVQILLQKGPELEAKDTNLSRTALARAAAMGHQAIAKMLIESGADIETRDCHGSTPLNSALHLRSDEMIQLLLDNGAHWDIDIDLRMTAMEWAVQSSSERLVQSLLERGASIDQKNYFGDTVLAVAARDGLESAVQILLDRGADWKLQNHEGETPLEQAVKYGHDSIVQLFLDRFTDPGSRDEMYQLLLFAASARGHMIFAQLSLQKGARINGKGLDGSTPLANAVRDGHDLLVDFLLKNGADPGSQDNFGRTPLSEAAKSGHCALVKLLLENGADAETMDQNGRTPLGYAAKWGHTSAVGLLLEQGANLESRDKNGSTPLAKAARRGHPSVVELLLEKGASLESRDNDGNTPLAKAAQWGQARVIEQLLANGASIESKDNQGSTPLAWAALWSHARVVRVLLKHGADLESEDRDGSTPLSKAVQRGLRQGIPGQLDHRVIKLLLRRGAQVEARDHHGRTPLVYAAQAGWASVAELLLDHGAEMEATDTAGMTPLLWAARRGSTRVVKLLLERGANSEAEDGIGMNALSWAVDEGHGEMSREARAITTKLVKATKLFIGNTYLSRPKPPLEVPLSPHHLYHQVSNILDSSTYSHLKAICEPL